MRAIVPCLPPDAGLRAARLAAVDHREQECLLSGAGARGSPRVRCAVQHAHATAAAAGGKNNAISVN